MDPHTRAALRRGIEAAVLAGVPQVVLPKVEEVLLLEPEESADVGPHFIQALAHHARKPLPEDMKWMGAAAFHFSYSAAWGAAYAMAYERRPVHPWVGGLLLGGLIYVVTFPRWGVAVLTGTEDPPGERSWRQELVLATAPLTFGLVTALLYGRGPRTGLAAALSEWWTERGPGRLRHPGG